MSDRTEGLRVVYLRNLTCCPTVMAALLQGSVSRLSIHFISLFIHFISLFIHFISLFIHFIGFDPWDSRLRRVNISNSFVSMLEELLVDVHLRLYKARNGQDFFALRSLTGCGQVYLWVDVVSQAVVALGLVSQWVRFLPADCCWVGNGLFGISHTGREKGGGIRHTHTLFFFIHKLNQY